MVRDIPYLQVAGYRPVDKHRCRIVLTSVCMDMVRPPTAMVVFTMRSLTPLVTTSDPCQCFFT